MTSSNHPIGNRFWNAFLPVGLLLAGLGASVLFGWYTHNYRLLQVYPGFVAMAYNTALGFLCQGIAFLSLGSKDTRPGRMIVTVSTIVVFLIGFLTLMEYVFDCNVHLDELFMKEYISSGITNPTRMACCTAVCFVLSAAGLAAYVLPFRRFRIGLLWLFGSVIVGLGMIALSGYFSGIMSAYYQWGKLTRMAVHTTGGFIVCGWGIYFCAWQDCHVHRYRIFRWLAIPIGIGGCAITVCLWQILIVDQNVQQRRMSNLEAVNVRNQISSEVSIRTGALQRLAQAWEHYGRPTKLSWQYNANLDIAMTRGYQAIEWVDRSGTIRWVSPSDGNMQAIGVNLNSLPNRTQVLAESRRKGGLYMTGVVPLLQGGTGIAGFVPINSGRDFDGYIAGVFRANELLDQIVDSDLTKGYIVDIYEDRNHIFNRNGNASRSADAPRALSDVVLPGLRLQVAVQPSLETSRLNSSNAPLATLISGLLLSALLGWALYLANIAREREEKSAQLNIVLTELIQERDRTEIALRDSEKRYRSVTESANDAIIAADSAGRILSWNKGAERLFGYSESEVEGEMITKLMPESFREAHVAGVKQRREHGTGSVLGQTVELQGLSKDGRVFPLELSLSGWNASGETFYTGIIRDITERKRASDEVQAYLLQLDEARIQAEKQSEELALARDQALASTYAKSQFLANMSHEIRTPMNGVIGMTGLLLDTPLTDEQVDYAQTIRQSADSLLTIINDILDFSKIEAGKMSIEVTDFDLNVAMDEVRELLLPRAAHSGLSLSIRYSDDLPRTFRGDPGRIKQVVTNFVGNAIKFTASGTVEIDVRIPDCAAKSNIVWIGIKDTGIGIAPDRLEAIFDSFTQADGSTSRKYGGTGLGLAISTQLVELMGGKIGVTSTLGEGSTFWVELPLERAFVESEIQISPIRPMPISCDTPLRLRVLLAEDNAINQKLALRLLDKWGCRAEGVANGIEAIAAWQQFPYDAILMDVQMPEMDGLDAASEIRRLERSSGRRIPIIAMTANAMSGDRERCLAAGMDDYLSKPIKHDELYAMLTAWTRQKAA